ncbi:MAG: bifunctional precorrin-2 dehydrogenase/sirohydrochlorin ferrochelatase [Fimbriimonadaceae bacterium]|nr:bifunctional precorrin-2 dehydrogenase/sirohydrochlorin ferrochelatase [Fimbriimonadaceae bacterium]
MSGWPVSLDLAGKRVLLVGGGAVGERKAGALLAAAADLLLVAPEVTARLAEWAAAGRLSWLARGWEPGDEAAAWLVVAATNRLDVNAAVAAAAAAQRIFCNVAAPPEAGSCQALAAVQRGPVLIGLGTAGASPFAAKKLRQAVEAAVPPEVGELVELLGELRPEIVARYADEAARRAAYERVWQSAARDALAAGEAVAARAAARAAMEEA